MAHEASHLQSGLSQVWLTSTLMFSCCPLSLVSMEGEREPGMRGKLTMVVDFLRSGGGEGIPITLAGLYTTQGRQRHFVATVETASPGASDGRRSDETRSRRVRNEISSGAG